MKRLNTVVALLVVAGGLTACGGSGASGDATVQATRPSSSGSAASPSSSSLSSSQAGGAAAAKLPDGFPFPDGAQAQGEAMTSDTVTLADYTLPDGKKAYDGLVSELPKAGWTISAKSWSDDLGSGTITAAGNGTDVKLLVLDKDLSLSIKKS